MPPIVSNRALKRQPLNIYYLRKHLLQSKPSIPRNRNLSESSHRPVHTQTLSSSTTSLDISGRHFEQPLPVNSFIGGSNTTQFTGTSSGDVYTNIQAVPYGIDSTITHTDISAITEDNVTIVDRNDLHHPMERGVCNERELDDGGGSDDKIARTDCVLLERAEERKECEFTA